MTKFEQYLYDIGYFPHMEIWSKENGNKKTIHIPISIKDASSFSTLDKITNVWKKEGCKDIYFGIDEKGKPPTLVSPVLFNYAIRQEDGNVLTPNDLTNRFIADNKCEVIYDAIIKINV